MRSQPNRDYVSNDDIQTPLALARRLVAHFEPQGKILEPCRGHGNFLKALREHQRLSAKISGLKKSEISWCEVKLARDFFDWDQPVDWIITNPPWSQIRDFLCHAMEMADNVVFLFTINHLWTKARLRDIRNADHGIREIVLVDMPKTFPQSGFQLGAVHLQYGWKGKITLCELDESRGGSLTRLKNQ